MTKKAKLKIDNIIYILTLDDILYCQSDESGSTLFRADHTSEHINANLNILEKKLSTHFFWRTDNTHLVNLKCLVEVSSNTKSEIILSDNSRIPIDPKRKQDLIEALSQLH